MKQKLLLFDLDGTLLRSDKTISNYTLDVLNKCREKGFTIGVSTSRSVQNSLQFISELDPEIIISSGGALVQWNKESIYAAEFSVSETKEFIQTARKICGVDCEITIDTIDNHYWNYKIDPKKADASWGESIYSDFNEFDQKALKICVEIHDLETARQMMLQFSEYDCIRFSDGDWYKFTKKDVTKEKAILCICEVCKISSNEIVAFGDDFADIGMLKLCGNGIAMGNAIDELKKIADDVIGTNDEDGIAKYLETTYL